MLRTQGLREDLYKGGYIEGSIGSTLVTEGQTDCGRRGGGVEVEAEVEIAHCTRTSIPS